MNVKRTPIRSVYVVQHSYEVDDIEDVKMIGVYGSAEEARAAIERVSGQPGFRNYPEGFSIDEYEIGRDHWQEGFATMSTVMMPILEGGGETFCPVIAERLPGHVYRLIGVARRQPLDGDAQNERDTYWKFKIGQCVHCTNEVVEGEACLIASQLVDECPPTEPA